MVSRALSCIAARSSSTNDTYAIALSTYSLVLGNHKQASSMLKLLRAKAITEGKNKTIY